MSGAAAGWVAAGATLLVVLLAAPARPQLTAPPGPGDPSVTPAPDERGWMRRARPVWSGLAAVGVAAFLGSGAGLVLAPVAALGVWVVIGRAESPASRRRREAVRRDLPHVVALLGAALRSGAGPAAAVGEVARALPGPAAERLAVVGARLALGADPVGAWTELGRDAELGPLGRTMARAQRSGAPVVAAVDRLAEELANTARGEVEDLARAVGVRAAVPLGLCLLPAFVLIGIVPLAASLLEGLGW